MGFKPISNELFSILAQWVDSPDAREGVVIATWQRVVGEAVTERSRPRALEGSKLVVDVADPAWGPVLEEMSADLLVRLNGALGKSVVRSIEWRLPEE